MLDENAVLSRELAGAQQRCTRQADEHARRTDLLHSLVMQMRAQLMARELERLMGQRHEQQRALLLARHGGMEDSEAKLDATLAAADLVICQTGCVSHNAYWRVKGHCKRTGKRCVFVESPSNAGIKRALLRRCNRRGI